MKKTILLVATLLLFNLLNSQITSGSKDNEVGSIIGGFSVSPSGASVYSINIELPPGVAGMTPELGLVYNSQGGYGVLGSGWGIGGLSVISRTTDTYYFNGFPKEVNFAGDQLSMDGVKMIKVDQHANEYRLEIDNMTRITKHYMKNSILQDATKYVAQTKGGIIKTYGGTDESHLLYGNSANGALMYYISSIEDKFGNTIIYNYSQDISIGSLYLESITYASDFKVEFIYHDMLPKHTKTVYFPYGANSYDHYEYVVDKRLAAIILKNNHEEIRRYTINYEIKGQLDEYVVTSVAVDSQGDKLTPSTFFWEETIPSLNTQSINFSDFMSQPPSSFNPLSFENGDYNNDGITDKAIFFKKNGNTSINLSMHGIQTNTVFNEYIKSICSGDFNGDGKEELLIKTPQDDYKVIEYVFDPNTNSYIVNISDRCFNEPIDGGVSGDFNGDGLTDFLHYDKEGSGKLSLFIGDIDKKLKVTRIYHNIGLDCDLYPGDYDSEGKTEVLLVKDNETLSMVELSRVNNQFIEYEITLTDKGDQYSIEKNDELFSDFFYEKRPVLLIADFNKDGKSDILKTQTDNDYVTYYFSSGYGFVRQNVTPILINNDGIYTSDVNGDGISDIITLHYDDDDKSYTAKYRYSNIDGLTLEEGVEFLLFEDYGRELTTLDQVGFGNYRGIGKNILSFASRTHPEDPYLGVGFDVKTCYYGEGYMNKISEIIDGLGKKIKITYESLPISDHYSQDIIDIDISLKQICPVKKIVTEVEKDNGMNNFFNPITYEYKNAIAHRLGKGFVGFREFIVKNGISNNYTRNIFDVYIGDEDKYYYPYKKTTEQYLLDGVARGDIVSTTNNVLSNLNYANSEYSLVLFQYVSKSVTNQYNPNTGSLIKLIEVTKENYDDYGNPGKITLDKYKYNGFFGVSHHKSESVFQYWNDIEDGCWVLGRLFDLEVTKEFVGVSSIPKITKHSVYSYYEDKNLPTYGKLKSETLEPDNPNSYTKKYLYGELGNVTTTIVDSYNNPSEKTERISNKIFGDDYNGRFVTEVIDPVSFKNTFRHNPHWGWITHTTDANGFEVISDYNKYGLVLRTVFHDGVSVSNSTNWVSSTDKEAPEYSIYYVVESSDGKPPVKIYYDLLKRKLRSVVTGLNGEKIFTDWSYNTNNGLLETVSNPYFSGEEKMITTYYYDEMNRIIRKELPGNRNYTKEYLGANVVSTNPNNQSTYEWLSVNDQVLLSIENFSGSFNETMNHRMYDVTGNIIKAAVAGKENSYISCEYDIFGQLTSITDPAIGTKEYKYNCFGELIEYKHKGTVEADNFVYDKLGRIISFDEPGHGSYIYSYDVSFKGLPECLSFEGAQNDNVFKNHFGYDDLGRNNRITETIAFEGNKENYTTEITYDKLSRVENYIYPTGYSITHTYNENGYLNRISQTSDNMSLWELIGLNAKQQVEATKCGNQIIAVNDYYMETGFVKSQYLTQPGKEYSKSVGTLIDQMNYEWDGIGNLLSRYKLNNSGAVTLSESFTYDELNRLISTNLNDGFAKVDLEYDELGRILSKKSENDDFHVADKYSYDDSGTNPYKLLTIDNKPAFYNPLKQIIDYTPFDKIEKIEQFNDDNSKVSELVINYGLNHQRKVQRLYDFAANNFQTKFYIGSNFEKVINSNSVEYVHYLSSVDGLFAIYTQTEDQDDDMKYVHKDHLGSITTLTTDNGDIYEQLSYDAWGLRRDPLTWVPYNEVTNNKTDRGFTGHEHLDLFAMINMNGRVYDPVIGYFSSPDPMIGIPVGTQGFNLYSYAHNNPLSYVDPSGFMASEVGDIGATPVKVELSSTIVELAAAGAFDEATAYFAGVFAGAFDKAIENGKTMEDALNQAKQAASVAFAQSSFGISSDNPYKSVSAYKNLVNVLSNPGKAIGTNNINTGGTASYGKDVGQAIMSDAGALVTKNGQTKFSNSTTVVQNAIAGTNDKWGSYANAAATNTALITLGEVEISGGSDKIGGGEYGLVGITNSVVGYVSYASGIISNTLTSTKAGSDIAYYLSNSKAFVNSAKYLKPITYGASGVCLFSDFYLSKTGQQSWTESGINTGVTIGATIVGGWLGIGLQAQYQASKGYMRTISKHPDWVLPATYHSFTH